MIDREGIVYVSFLAGGYQQLNSLLYSTQHRRPLHNVLVVWCCDDREQRPCCPRISLLSICDNGAMKTTKTALCHRVALLWKASRVLFCSLD